jgi:hypothetical protein
VLATELALAVAGPPDLDVAPPLAYGYRSRPLSGGGQSFPGTVSLGARTLMALLEDVERARRQRLRPPGGPELAFRERGPGRAGEGSVASWLPLWAAPGRVASRWLGSYLQGEDEPLTLEAGPRLGPPRGGLRVKALGAPC